LSGANSKLQKHFDLQIEMSTERLSPLPKYRSLKKRPAAPSTPTSKKVEGKVAVLVRIRPYISKEDSSKESPFSIQNNLVEYTDPGRQTSGAFQFGKFVKLKLT
jgi:hypothetical protein